MGDDQIIEVKCPSSAISMQPLDALAKGKIKCLEMQDGTPQLKLSHNYMSQIQGVLHISRRKTCNFVLLTFLYDSLLPEIIDPRHPINMPIRERPHIKSAQEAKRETKKSETRASVETTEIIL
ncbi:hypothetical protein PR048_027961 [Dryococelus australis]|uniref:YqaJ viral recombinase domain-containing protein n=1 Tax=Dryococelus australis TaxID=614101 RepID=A0ABQ9GHW9_9NEOP|nr:hypothetical protein PR048_027961 [Dryococelus australis]